MDKQAAKSCGQCVGAWKGARGRMVEKFGDWEEHTRLRKEYRSGMQSNCGCRECVNWVWCGSRGGDRFFI